MALKVSSAPYVRNKKSTFQIMIEVTIALCFVWLAAIIATYVRLGSSYGTKSILLMVVSLGVTLLCDFLYSVCRNKKDKTFWKNVKRDLIHNYSWVTAMIFTLCCPVWTRYYVIIVGSIFATMIGKLVFGGFGKNIFNPALMGRIFIAICFSSDLSVPEGLVVGGSDAAAGATIANVMQSSSGWLTNGAIEGYSVMDLFLGNYFAAMGETFTLLLIVIGIILIIRKDIQWRAPVFYIGTVGITTLIIGLLLNFKNPFLFAYYHLAAGGLMFAAVFMITDPVTTPTSRFGNCLVGVIAGLMTVLIRIGTNSAEGVMYSIAIVNLITPMIDGLVKGKTNARIGAKYGITFGTLALSIILTSCVAWSENGGRTIYSINGIDIAEYNTITENIPLDFISENNYKYKVYDKEITSEKAIDQETYGYAPAYYVCNSKKETIGVMYTVKVSQKIYNGYDYVNRSGTTSVVFDINNGNILAIYTNPAATTSHYSDLVVDAVNELDYTNLTNADLQAIEGKDFAVGASYTSAFLISSVQAAYDIYLAAFGA